jgi:hypothetical protein
VFLQRGNSVLVAVIQVWPGHTRGPRWAMIPYLIAADLVNTALAAAMTFASRALVSDLRARPTPLGNFCARRSGERRRDHVGPGINRHAAPSSSAGSARGISTAPENRARNCPRASPPQSCSQETAAGSSSM